MAWHAMEPAPGFPRRRFLTAGIGGLVALAGTGLPAAQPLPMRDYRFRVLRDGSEIGTHNVSFSGSPDNLESQTTIRLAVRVAFITAFRFAHDAEERWEKGSLVFLRTKTDDNGTVYEVSGGPAAGGFRVVGPGGPLITPSGLLTSTALWHPAYVRQSLLINAQQGGEIGLSVRKVAEEPMSGAGGGGMSEKYRMITPQCSGYVWYDNAMRWLRAELNIKGERLRYEAA